MKRIIAKVKGVYLKHKLLRAATPIAAAIMGARCLAQCQGTNDTVDFKEISHEAILLAKALQEEVYYEA